MSFSPVVGASRGQVRSGPDPFSSLAAAPASRWPWLVELVLAPFRDLDERAHYSAAKKAAAKDGGQALLAEMMPTARHPA